MTRDEIMRMDAEELTNAILRIRNHWDDEDFTLPRDARFEYATSIADAWELFEEIRKKYFSTSVFCWDHNDDWWIDCTPRSGHDEEKEDLTVWAKSFPMLICRAWLMAQEAQP